MRYAPTLFSRGYAAAPGAVDLSAFQRGEAGADGESWLYDLISGGPDINPELTGHLKFLEYDEMRKTDSTVKSMLMLLKLPVRAATWNLDPRSDDPGDRLIRDFVAWNLGLPDHDGRDQDGHLDYSWDEQLQQILQMLDFGCMFEELVWDFTPGKPLVTWYDSDGDPHDTVPLARLGPRSPKSIVRVWQDRGKVTKVQQRTSLAEPIPGSKLSHVIWERDGSTWDGISLLRPVWGPWRIKKALMIAAGIGFDRYASGTPVIYHPDNAADEEKARDIGRSLRVHERGYAHFPSNGMAAPGVPDSAWLLDILNGATSLADPVPLLRFFCDQIYDAGMEQFARSGGSGHGSNRATAQVQVDPYFLAVEALAGHVRRERGRQVIREIVRVNFGPEAADRRAPILTVSKIQARNLEVIANAVAMFDQAGLTFTDRDAQNDVRDMLGFPALADDELAARGIDAAKLEQMLRAAGVDSATFAAVVAQLPPELGVARNTVPAKEGAGLPAGA